MMIPTLALLAIMLYLVATGILMRPLLDRGHSPALLATGAAVIAVLAHIGVLLGMHRGALDLHFYAALSLVACGVAALTLLVNLSRPVAALGLIVFPLAALLLGIDVFHRPHPKSSTGKSSCM